jgi:outer membrane protein assembly factor BamB
MHNLALGSNLKQAFATSVGRGSDSYGRLTASPIVAGGQVFVLDSRAEVHAVSAERWHRQGGRAPWCLKIAAAGARSAADLPPMGRAFTPRAPFGEVVALDARTGSEIWRKEVRCARYGARRRSPMAACSLPPSATTCHAISMPSDGSSLWRYQGIGEQASIVASPSPVVANGHVVVPHTTGELVAFRADDGMPVWTETLTSLQPTSSLANLNDIAGRPVIADGRVYAIAHSGRLGAFQLTTGEPEWAQEISGTQMPWVAGDHAFVINGTATLAAVERRGGGVRWTTNLPGGGVWSGPVIGGGRLIVVSSTGMLANISPQTGEVLSTTNLGEEFYIAPVIANGTIYLLADSGTLIALR